MITIDWWKFGYRESVGDSYYWQAHNGVGGVDVYIQFRNKGEKTIKYVYFEMFPKNAVGDAIECDVTGNCSVRLKRTGPIEPGNVSGGLDSHWANVWYSYQIHTVTITNILIEYMDGTTEEQKYVATPEDELKSGGCYVATCVYGSYDCPEVWTLRRFRDYTLAQSLMGRAFIKFYYTVSPTLVKWFGKTSWFKAIWKTPLDALVKKLQFRGVSSLPYKDE